MADIRAQQLRALRDAEAKLYALDDQTVNRLAAMYEAVRAKLTAALLEWYNRQGAPTDPAQLRVMASEIDRIRQIETTLKGLSKEVAAYFENALPAAQSIGLDNAEAEVARFAQALRVRLDPKKLFTGIDKQLATVVDSVVKQIPNIVMPLADQISFELQYALTQGDSFAQTVDRLLAAEPTAQGVSFFRRGRLSMELFTRRSIIDANNASRQLVYENAQRTLPKLQKQAIAAVDNRTTDCCLKVNGQIQPLDKPFHLTGTPRFAPYIQFPAFHWNCRTSSVAYLPQFEENSSATTQSMIDKSKKQLKANEQSGASNAATI